MEYTNIISVFRSSVRSNRVVVEVEVAAIIVVVAIVVVVGQSVGSGHWFS